MGRKTIIVLLFILLIIDLALGYRSYQAGKVPAYDLVAVREGEIAQIISATGAVQPASQINLQFTGAGKITDIAVKIGDKVSAGQILIRQDSADLAFQAQSAQAALEIAQARLNQLLAGASAEDIALAQTAVQNAQKSLEDANKSLLDTQTAADNLIKDYYEDSQRVLDVSLLAAQNSIVSNDDILTASNLQATFSVLNSQALIEANSLKLTAKQDYEIAKAAVNNSKNSNRQSDIDIAADKLKIASFSVYSALGKTYDALVATTISSVLTQAQLDAYKLTISTARANVNTGLTNVVSAQQTISSQKITNQTNLNIYQAKVVVAQGALQTAQDQLAQRIAKPRSADVDLYQAQVKQAQANLNQVRNQITQKSLAAPLDGLITNVAVEKGETASPSQSVISMNSLSNFEIKADIPESDIAKINLGNPVSITFDAFGQNEIWQGKVAKINPAETISQGVVYYEITVGISGDDTKVRAGMTANLDIETARHENILVIPSRAIKENKNIKTVIILDNGQKKEVIITTGLKNSEGEIEVASGLKEGDKLVIEKTQ